MNLSIVAFNAHKMEKILKNKKFIFCHHTSVATPDDIYQHRRILLVPASH
jgi:hypothetical protein